MARLLWLADVLRAAGLVVHEYDGWRTRGSDPPENPYGPLRGVVCHATAGSRSSTDASETRVLWVTGSTSAPAPISQLFLSRSGGWWVGASGRCNHVLTGDRGPHRGYGNDALIGIEAANDNRGEPWPPAQLDAYIRGVATICRHMGWPAPVVVGHREHQSDKTDPAGIDMNAFRAAVAALMEGDDVSAAEVWTAQIPKQATPADPRMSAPAQDIVGGTAIAAWATLDELRALATAQAARTAAEETRDKAGAAAIAALTELIRAGGGDADTAAILVRIDQHASEQATAATALQEQVHELRDALAAERATVAQLQDRLAQAARAEADTLAGEG